MIKLYLFALSLLLFLISACSSSPGLRNLQNGNSQAIHEWNATSDQVTIPFTWFDGHIIIPVSFNGSEPLHLAFDSGAAVTVLFESERTTKLKLDIERQLAINSSGQKANIVNHNIVNLIGIRLKDLTVLHVPLADSPIFSSVEEAYFDGAIGYDLLSRFQVKIDYLNQTLSFSNERVFTNNVSEWQAIPINTDARVPYIDAFLSSGDALYEKSSTLLIDTGAPFYLYINPDLEEHLTLPRYYYETTGMSFNGAYHRRTGLLGELRIGQYNFPMLATHFDTNDFKDLDGIGLVGNGVLKNFELIFDYQSKTLFMKSHKNFNSKSLLDRSGLSLKPHIKGAVVTDVALDSAAYVAGLRVDDVTTEFDGVAINSLNYDEFKKILSSERELVNLCWIRKSNTKCTSMTLSTRFNISQK